MTERRQHINRLIGLGASLLVIVGVLGLFTLFGFLDRQHLSGMKVTVKHSPETHRLLDSATLYQAIADLYPMSMAGLSIDSVSLETIEDLYRSNPFVKECKAYIDKHYMLQIELEERHPLIRILSENGGNYYVDRDGRSMPVSGNYTPRTMLATGHIPLLPLNDHVDSNSIHKDIFQVALAVESDEFMSGFVNEIHVDKAGNILFYPLVGDFTIRLNNLDQLNHKFENLKIFLRDGLSRIGWDQYSELVIGYENQIIGKKIVNP